jgi:serine/threonine protein kinase
MGEVYRATDANLKRQVAIKVLPHAVATDPERLARFQREAEVLAVLNHPNIAHIYGVERSGGAFALVMELVEGATLADRIAQGALPPAEALPLAKQIAEALEAAHEHGIVHRDLKPTNIKVRSDGAVKVLDFGLAKALEPMGAATASASISPTLSLHATQAGIILGTAAYMSPEQAAGRPVDKRSDLWAFGVVLLEMLTGRQVFDGKTVSHVLAAVLTKDPNWAALPPNTPASIRRVLRRCLEKDRKQRCDSATDVRLEIQDALAAPAVEISPATSGPRRNRWGWLAAGVMIGLAVASVAATLYLRRPTDTAPTRFSIPIPDVGPFGSFASVSPDGRRIAFVAQNSLSTSALFIRALDAQDAQMLPGTEGAIFPFWSPDSQSLGFGVQNQLKRIDLSGGPPQTVCDTPGAVIGGTWNTAGVIVFGSVPGPLKRVLASGGVPADLTAVSRPQEAHALPSFLPDGRHVLFVNTAGDVQNQKIEVASLDSKARMTVLKTASNFAFAPPGYLLFHRNATLMAQAFDASRLSLRGDPVRVAEGLALVQPAALADFAVSASVLVYRTGTAGAQSQLIWYDRTGKPLGPVGAPGEYRGLALSPDGTRIAVHWHQLPNGGDIWVLDQDRGTFQKFTLHPSHNFLPTWSRDGSMIAFSSDRDGGTLNLYQKQSNGAGSDELVLKSPRNKYPEDWAPDGQSMLYADIFDTGDPHIMVLPLIGARTPKALETVAFPEYLSKLSPDGRWIAYTSLEAGRPDVFVQPYPQRTGKWQISTQGGNYPRWARSGKELFYLTTDGTVMAVDVRTDGPTLGAGIPRVLFKTNALFGDHAAGGSEYPYDVTADGQRFIVNERLNPAVQTAPLTVVLNWQAALRN